MGTVWLCTDEMLGRSVAVKEVGHLPGESTPDLARALREARSSAALNHPNVVSIFDAVEDGDHIWLVMEFVPSRTLSQLMKEDGALDPHRVAWIGAQVADGLAAAHLRGTMHRDVKPGNILVADNDHAKISDFGIARTLGDSQLTQTGMVTGTPGYFSPGLARGEEPTAADDVWALGATLFAAVEGSPPFPEQGNALAMLSTIASSEPPQPERAGPLSDAIRNMLQLDPALRWSMADVAYHLHQVHDQQSATGTQEHVRPMALPAEEPSDGGDSTTLAEPVAEPEAEAEVQPELTPALPLAPDGHRERRRWLLPVLAAAAVVAALMVWSLVGRDGSGSADNDAARQTSPGSSSGQETTTTSPPADDEVAPAPEEASPPVSTGSPEQFVSDYYALLPGDTETAWQLLSSDMQAEVGSYADYEGFWSTIDSVTVDDTASVDADTVEVTLTYTTDGTSEQEVRQIELAKQGDGFVIVGD